MSRLVAGFILGVLSTLAVMHWFGRPAATPPAADGPVAKPVAPAAGSASAIAPRAGTTAPDAEAQAEGTSATAARLGDNAMPQPDIDVPSIDEPSVVPSAPARAAAQEPARPVEASTAQYPPEIAEMIERSVDPELQQRFESDAREDSWAPYMEGLLRAYFAEKPMLAQFYLSLIECRTSVCSVHAVGYGPDALTQWNVATADLVSQPWFEFTSMSMNRRNPVPDVFAVVLILTKEPPT